MFCGLKLVICYVLKNLSNTYIWSSNVITGLSQDEKKKINSCPGSPLSGCGSLCDHEENGKQHNLRCRKCRRNAKLAEKATEQMNVHFSDQVSLQSFQADDMVLDLPMGKHDIDSLSEMCNEEDSESDEGLEKCKGKRLAVRNNSEPAILLTEVESDHPEFCKAKEMGGVCDGRCPGKHKCQLSRGEVSEGESLASFASSISMKFGMTDGMNNHDESLLSRCRSEDIYKKKEIKEDIVSEKSKSEEIFNKDKSGAVGGGMKRVRRKSCELAIQNGRISPLSVISDD